MENIRLGGNLLYIGFYRFLRHGQPAPYANTYKYIIPYHNANTNTHSLPYRHTCPECNRRDVTDVIPYGHDDAVHDTDHHSPS
jgi:hypothetical protein